jgi:hypothetical protein
MAHIGDVGAALQHEFDPNRPDALEGLLQAAHARATDMRQQVEVLLEGGHTDAAYMLRERLAAITSKLGEAVTDFAFANDVKETLLTVWGVSADTIPAPGVADPGAPAPQGPASMEAGNGSRWLSPGSQQRMDKSIQIFLESLGAHGREKGIITETKWALAHHGIFTIGDVLVVGKTVLSRLRLGEVKVRAIQRAVHAAYPGAEIVPDCKATQAAELRDNVGQIPWVVLAKSPELLSIAYQYGENQVSVQDILTKTRTQLFMGKLSESEYRMLQVSARQYAAEFINAKAAQ